MNVNLLHVNTSTVKTENGRFCIKEFSLQAFVQRTEDKLMSHKHNAEEYCTIKINTLKV